MWPSAELWVDCICDDVCRIGALLTIKSAAVTVAVPAPSTFETWGAVVLTESLEFVERVSTDVAVVGRSEEVVRPETTWYFKICVRVPRQYHFTPMCRHYHNNNNHIVGNNNLRLEEEA